MTKEKKRKSFFEEFFGDLFKDVEEFGEGSFEKIGGGYSISITQIGDKTKVHVKADRNTDIQRLKKELEEQYPNAEIYIEGGKPIIEEIGKEERFKEEYKQKKKSLIEVIDEKQIKEE